MATGDNSKALAVAALGAFVSAIFGVPDMAVAEDKDPSSMVSAKADKSDGGGKADAPRKASVKAKTADEKATGPGPSPAAVEKKSYYVPTRGYRLEPQPDIPPYVRNLAKTYKEFEGVDWLNVGLDSRVRFEYRKDDYRPWTSTSTNPPSAQRKYFPNSLWLSRTRAYLGVQNILDPFRFVVELQDSRAYISIYEYQGPSRRLGQHRRQMAGRANFGRRQ